MATGLLTATVAALVPLAAGRSLLAPLALSTPDPLPSLSTSLLFDLGIYLMVLALVVAAVRRLGVPPAQPADLPETGGAR